MWINFLLFVIHMVSSSHFYGGTITWRIQNATNTSQIAIFISQTYAWTFTVAPCDTVAIATKKAVTVSAGTLVCTNSCPLKFGPVSTMGSCVDGSQLNNIGVGQRSDVAKAPENSSFSVIYQGYAWGGLTIAAGGWSILSKINLIRRSDNDLFNNAPVAIVISPINIEFNKTTIITISVSDPDGDILRCRWASKSRSADDECNSICPPTSLPAGTNISSDDCTIEIKGTILNSRYAVAIMIEDFINSTSTTALSAVPLQFLVQVIAPTKCGSPPSILYDGVSCLPIQVGETFTGQLFGATNCTPPTTIAEIATVSFPGMNFGRLVPINSQVYSRNFNWTATFDHLGYQVMCALAIDSNKLQSPQLCLTFYVTLNGSSACPGKAMSTGTTTPFALPSAIISITTKPTTSKCVTWPYYTSLAGLSAVALCCNCCLLCRYFGCGGFGGGERRTYRERSSNQPSRPIIPRISLVYLQDTNNVSPSKYRIAINRISPQLPSENSNLSSISEEFDTDRLITTVSNQH